jgi:protein-disulfide isomerase
MQLNRRKFIVFGAGATALAAGYSAFAPSSREYASFVPGITSAHAQSVDLSDLAAAPAIGEKFLGKADAPVTVIEYASATCPHCARFHEGTFKQLKTEYIDTGKVKFVFREFPFDDLALAAFMLARCAPEDKYFPMIDVLFEQQAVWSRNNPKGELFKIAKLAGFTEETFEACLKNEEIYKGIVAIREKAGTSYGVDSTPTFFINGQKMQGNQDFDAFKKMIEAAG